MSNLRQNILSIVRWFSFGTNHVTICNSIFDDPQIWVQTTRE